MLGNESPPSYSGRGSYYIEFGAERVGRVDVTFRPGIPPPGSFFELSVAIAAEKKEFGDSRQARWFGL